MPIHLLRGRKNESARFQTYTLTFDNKRRGDKQYPMDVYYHYGSGSFEKFQARNFGGDKKDWKLELKGENALQGKIQGKVVFELLTNAGFRNLPSEADWAKSNGNDYDDEIYKLLKKHRAAGLPTQKEYCNEYHCTTKTILEV